MSSTLAPCNQRHYGGCARDFSPDAKDEDDPLSVKKLKKDEGKWAMKKDCLSFTFDGKNKTCWLEQPKREAILTVMKGWIKGAKNEVAIPFQEFQSVISKLRHAFISIPHGKGLLSPMNAVLRVEPDMVYLHRNHPLLTAVTECRILLRESTLAPTQCKELVSAWPDYVGVKDASKHGVGGIIIGEGKACTPTVFRYEWPPDIKASLVSFDNPCGTITNSDLEMAGLLMLYLIMEVVCNLIIGAHVALFSDNQPTVSWVKRLAAKSSLIAGQLLRALVLRMKKRGTSPLTPLHIPGPQNQMTDIPSRSFGSEPKWHCIDDSDLLTLFNNKFPLPKQASWTVFRPSKEICMKVLSVLRMKGTTMEEWTQPPKIGKHIGKIGGPSSSLWEWTLRYRIPHLGTKSVHSLDLQHSNELATMVEENKSKLQQSLALSRPLARRSPWSTK